MAAFKQDPDEWQRLDWQLLQNSPITLYFSASVLETDLDWFRRQAYRIVPVLGLEHASPEDALVELGQLLGFPDCFGRNLDAFNDCLSDVDVPDLGGLVLVLRDFNSFSARFQSTAHALLDICADNSRRFLMMGRRFLVLVESHDPTIALEAVGATPVMWNPREFLNASRGL